MPEVELCCHCDKEIECDQEKFLVVALEGKEGNTSPRRIAHVECEQKARAQRARSSRTPRE
jgi:hypothetical protein